MPIPTPPADASGGYMLLNYTDGTHSHNMRLHVLAFLGAAGAAGTRAYTTTSLLSTSEADTNATFAAYALKWKALYTANWTLSVVGLFQIVSGNPLELFPTPTPTAVVGTHGAGEALLPEVEQTWSTRTANGGRFKQVFIALAGDTPAAPITILANAGGTIYQQMAAYLTGAATAVVGHDGGRALPPFHATVCLNRRLRRHYGHA